MLESFLILLILILIYFFPFIIARDRKHPNQASIFVVNIFFGWTLLGWVLALVWAVSSFKASTSVDDKS